MNACSIKKVGTSAPKADPSGDYAFEIFRKAEASRSGAQTVLENKALQLTGRQIMKLSARNQLKGKIVDVKKGATTAHVRINIGGQTLTASITNESADELKLEKGKTAYAIFKATSVMIGVD